MKNNYLFLFGLLFLKKIICSGILNTTIFKFSIDLDKEYYYQYDGTKIMDNILSEFQTDAIILINKEDNFYFNITKKIILQNNISFK